MQGGGARGGGARGQNVAVLKAEHETGLAAAQHASSISEARADAPDISPMRPGEAVTEEGGAGEERRARRAWRTRRTRGITTTSPNA